MKSSGQIFIFSILKTFTEIVFLISVLFPHLLFAQMTEDFSDNEIAQNPTWAGSVNDFVVTDGWLQLTAAPDSKSAYLSTSFERRAITTWEFSIRLGFNPSSSNYCRVYLTADAPDLSGDLTGYYVMLGNTADEISLYYQSGSTKTKIIDGQDGLLNTTEPLVNVKVTLNSDGLWELASDVNASGQFTVEGTVTHLPGTYFTNYFGVQCVFTSTRADKFFFDDITIASETIPDTTPPIVDSVKVLSENQLQIYFSEAIVIDSQNSAGMFDVSGSLGQPTTIALEEDQQIVDLTFANTFSKDVVYAIEISNIHDLSGNYITPTAFAFSFSPLVIPGYKDLIITEIFPDPNPTHGLPEVEFVELFNRSSGTISTKGFTITDGSSVGRLPDIRIKSNNYVILTASSAVGEFDSALQVVGITSFPSLNNDGDHIVIKDGFNTVLDSLAYDASWYRDEEKEAGGWTLELINVNNTCGEEQNWSASESEIGGTPGLPNSIAEEKPDLHGPRLLDVIAVALDTIALTFDEKLAATVPPVTSIAISPEVGVASLILNSTLRKIDVVLTTPLFKSTPYTIMLTAIYDCPGNEIESCCNTLKFAIPEQADSLDVVINEVLFNPRASGVDFVEIVNTSAKYIDLKNWRIANLASDSTGTLISEESFLLGPFEYIALTSDPAVLGNEYPGSSQRFLKTKLPSFSDESGTPLLINEDEIQMDHFSYSSSMHSPFIQNNEGVSLERLSFSVPAIIPENWKSASAASGFATPGDKNSNAYIGEPSGNEITVSPEIFLPVYGNPDYTMISYNLPTAGNVGSIRVYDAQGQTVKSIVDGTLLGMQGFYRWEGDRDDGLKARAGTYMIWIELYNSDGVVKRIRKRVVIAPRF